MIPQNQRTEYPEDLPARGGLLVGLVIVALCATVALALGLF